MRRHLIDMKTSTLQRQRGLTLIESLVAIFVAALGVLGIIGVQMRTLSDTQTTVRRAQAIRLIEDLSERMKVHPNALSVLSDYTSGWTTSLPTPDAGRDCGSNTCNMSQLAAYDLAEWKQSVQRSLPLGDANLFIAPGDSTNVDNRRQLGVMISWRENERSDADAAYRTSISTSTDGGTVTCPANLSCHLQYLPLSARCTPYRPNPASPFLYFCPGP